MPITSIRGRLGLDNRRRDNSAQPRLCATAIKKEAQYAPGFANILVFVNHNDALESAVNEFDYAVRKHRGSAN